MNKKLKKFKNEISKSNITEYFKDPDKFQLDDIHQEIDLTEVLKKMDILKNKDNIINEDGEKLSIPQSDSIIAPTLHKTFKNIPSKLFLDRSFLQYLSLNIFQDYTWNRWFRYKKSSQVPKTNLEKIECINNGSINIDHFIPTSAFKGITSLHSISRLYWPCEILFDENNNYELATKSFFKQDVSVTIFQRQYSFNQNLAKKLVEIFTRKDENGEFIFKGEEGRVNVRREAKKLNFYGSTMSLDHLDLDNLENLLSLN
mgnify:CR=1 FL=1|tara:strand:+ start:2101 stop:2874 length:774 start_codon:yes stop_codon:yes gene_type:complete